MTFPSTRDNQVPCSRRRGVFHVRAVFTRFGGNADATLTTTTTTTTSVAARDSKSKWKNGDGSEWREDRKKEGTTGKNSTNPRKVTRSLNRHEGRVIDDGGVGETEVYLACTSSAAALHLYNDTCGTPPVYEVVQNTRRPECNSDIMQTTKLSSGRETAPRSVDNAEPYVTTTAKPVQDTGTLAQVTCTAVVTALFVTR